MGTGAALGAWLRWGLSAWLNPRAAAFSAGHARGQPDRRLSGRLRRRVLRGAARSRAGVPAVRDHRLSRRAHDVLDVFGRSHATAAARRLRDRRRPRARASRGLAAAHRRRLRHVSRARRLIRRPLPQLRGDIHAPRHPHPRHRRSRSHALGGGRRRRSRPGRGARAPHGGRRQLHRHLPSQRPLQAAAAVRHGLRGGGRRRGGRRRRRLGEARRSRRVLRRPARRVQRGARDAGRPAGQAARRHLRSRRRRR